MRKSLIIVGAAVLVIAASYAVLMIVKPFQKKSDYPVLPYLLDAGDKEITRLSIGTKGAPALVFVKKGEVYQVEGRESVILDTGRVEQAFSTFMGLRPYSVVDENPENPSDFGFGSPWLAEATLADGEKLRLEIGSKTPNGEYYIRKSGEATIYTLSSWTAEGAMGSLTDYRKKDLQTVDFQKLTAFRLVTGGRTIEIMPSADTRSTMSAHLMVKPYRGSYDINSQPFGELLQKIPAFAIKSFVDAPKALSSYGLAPPVSELEVADDLSGLHLLFGKDAGNDAVYAKLAGDAGVFTLAKSDLDFMKDAIPFKLVSRLGMLTNIDSVDTISFRASADSYFMEIKNRPADTETNEGEEEPVPDYYVNGNKVEEDVFKKIYQTIIGIQYEGENPKPSAFPSGKKADVKVVFGLTGGKGSREYDFVSSNADYYAFYDKGYSEFLVTKSQVDTAVAIIKKRLSGELTD